MYSIVYYVAGIYFHEAPRKVNKSVCVLMVAIGFLMATTEVILNTHIDKKMFDGVNSSFPTIGALCMAIGIFNLLKTINYSEKAEKIMMKLSPYVLSVYVMHLLFITIYEKIISKPRYISLLTGFIITIIIDGSCIVTGMILNKIPYLKELIKI